MSVLTTHIPQIKTDNVQTYIPSSTSIQCVPLSIEESKKRPRVRINFCVPGESFSARFLQCWTQMLSWANNTNLDFYMYNIECSNISHGREVLLQGDLNGGSEQKPFHGDPYNYILFVDSDQIWKPEDIDLLIRANKDVISGCIRMSDGNFAQGYYDEVEFAKHGYTIRLIEPFINSVQEPIEVSLMGCGFTLMKYGLIEEHLKFPWFRSLDYNYPKAGYYGEDMSFFTRLRRAGVKLYVHPKVRIGHEKTQVLY